MDSIVKKLILYKNNKTMTGKTNEHSDYNIHSYKTKNQLIRENIKRGERCEWYRIKIKELKQQNQKNIIELKEEIDHLNELIDLYKEEINQYKEKRFIKSFHQKTYLMKDLATGLYKIGKSKKPLEREKTLQSEKPTIKMVKCWNNDIEKKLHNIYNDYRVRGEWFELTNIQVRYMCTHF